jgi:hypothetical protein
MNTPARPRLRPEIWLLAMAAVLLLAQSIFHILAFPRLDDGLNDLAALTLRAPLPDFDVLRGAWMLYAIHLLIAALLCGACAVSPRLFGRGLRVALCVWLVLDTLVLLYFVGPFLGSILMGLAAAAVLIAALWPRSLDD